MTKQMYFLILAAVMLVLIPIVPNMLRLRVAIFRKFHWTWLADLHERNMGAFVMAVRIILLAMAVLLVVIALRY